MIQSRRSDEFLHSLGRTRSDTSGPVRPDSAIGIDAISTPPLSMFFGLTLRAVKSVTRDMLLSSATSPADDNNLAAPG
ncbi:hypothetical protein BN2475_180067 [Paraburkholderia ribeironis]|uniref:Uncharacterized protein n=1 Tax=Paraburkholderia ribeironis TaxID=1247936 RepID=A0A1N7RV45_9BURK|nr:hypothetical protein BN2475_180067 [Paraburkholderia ribeironis]